ncbi:MAG: hypothetical protein ACI4AM_05190 [Muribaculaceae bacterium]
MRRNLYVAIDPTTGAPIADKYELSSNISATSYVGWHTALEFHGVAHQPFYNAYVGSRSRFNRFTFEGIDFDYCAAPLEVSEHTGVIRAVGNPYVRVTDLERTIIDCIDRIDRAGGVEELLHCLESVTLLDENKLELYLNLYNKAFLYQKAGFILYHSRDYHHVSDTFIEMCRTKGALHTQSLTSTGECDTYLHSWKLYVPQSCTITNTPTEYELV